MYTSQQQSIAKEVCGPRWIWLDSIRRRDRDPSAFSWTYYVCTGEANQLKRASSRHLGSDARGVIWPDSGHGLF
jgi:hypothetical protein